MKQSLLQLGKEKKLRNLEKKKMKRQGEGKQLKKHREYTKSKMSEARKKIFEDKWVVVGVASSIPKLGDAKPFDLLGIPLILLRTKNNKINNNKPNLVS